MTQSEELKSLNFKLEMEYIFLGIALKYKANTNIFVVLIFISMLFEYYVILCQHEYYFCLRTFNMQCTL